MNAKRHLLKVFLLLITTLSCLTSSAQTAESEPNNSFAQANNIVKDSVKTGTGSNSDLNDFYTGTIPYDGTLKIVVSVTNTSGSSGSVYFNVYDSRQGNGTVLGKYIKNNNNVGAGVTLKDTILLYGRAAEQVYFQFQFSNNFSYTWHFEVKDSSKNDAEPNNNFSNALSIVPRQEMKGHIGYQANGGADADDYYRTKLPYDGTLKIMLRATLYNSGNGALYLNAYDGRKINGTLVGRYLKNNNNVAPYVTYYDTFYLYGRAVDSFFLRFQSSQFFSYAWHYEMLDSSQNDVEPNNDILNALNILPHQEMKGHIGYQASGSPDADDYYRTKLPYDGTLKIMLRATLYNSGNGALYMTAYDGRKTNGTLVGGYLKNNNNVAPYVTYYDTFYLYGRAVDSFFLRFQSSQFFSYAWHYEMLDSSQNDVEPNNDILNALNILPHQEMKGHIGYQASGSPDADDYYRTKLPYDGTLKIMLRATLYNSGNGALYLNAYDGRKTNGTLVGRYLKNNNNVAPYVTYYDTFYLYGRAVDSFFLRFQSSQFFSYAWHYEMLDSSQNDVEPNNDFTNALSIVPRQEMKGHIGYQANGGSDVDDYYRTKLPYDGTIKIVLRATLYNSGNGALYLNAYDGRKTNGTLVGRYLINNNNVAPYVTYYDTFYLYGRGVDSFFLRFQSSQFFSYAWHYEMLDSSQNDVEPNNSFTAALPLQFNKLKRGHIGYEAKGVKDDNDFYVLPINAFGSLEITCKVTNFMSSGNAVYLVGYDKRKFNGTLFGRYVGNNNNIKAGATLSDKFTLDCFGSDTFYFLLSSGGSFSYEFSVRFISRNPNAKLVYERLGNTFGFRTNISNADKFQWDFGDNTTSTSEYPIKTYAKGGYLVKLIATNSVCNRKDTSSTIIEVKGLEYYTPKSAGAGGDASMQLFGGGLDTNVVVKLTRGSTTLVPVEKYTNTLHNKLTAVFDFHFAQEGLYDVSVQYPGDTPILFKNGFNVEKLKYPYTWSQIQGPSRARNNIETPFSLVVGNKGNVVASGVVCALVWPKNISIRFKDHQIKPPRTGIDSVYVPAQSKLYTLPRSEYTFLYDSLNTTTPIDSFEGKPYNGYIRYLLIPKVPANSTVEMVFYVKSNASAQSNKIYTYTHKPNLWGSCPTGNWEDYHEDLTAELIDGADMLADKTKIPLAKAFTVSAKIGQKHLGNAANYMGKYFWAWYDGYEVDENQAYADYMAENEVANAYAAQVATDELGNFLLNKGIGKLNKTYQDQVEGINKVIANNKSLSPRSVESYLKILNRLSNDNKRLNKLKQLFDDTKNLGTLSDKLLKIQQLADDCPEIKKQLEDLLNEADKELDHGDLNGKDFQTANSFDPNEISGPTGYGTKRYLNNLDQQHFQVSFENVDTATASAQIVSITDTLDLKKFDAHSFEFSDLMIGNERYRLPKGRNQFVTEINYNSTLKVRVNGRFDTLSGIAYWQFTSIDKATGHLPLFDGFLPPNVNKPEGQGAVSYTVKPLQSLVSKTVLNNRASIVFDDNAPIITNTWTNTIDLGKPGSTITAKRIDSFGNIQLVLNGSDAESGVGYYNLFVKINGDNWVAFGGTPYDTVKVTADYGHTYAFCARALDNVGNLEDKALTEEAVLNVTNRAHTSKRIYLYPNPTDGKVHFSETVKELSAYHVYDITGKQLQTGTVLNNSIDLKTLETGFYILQIDNGTSFKIWKN